MSCWQEPGRVRSSSTSVGRRGDTLLQGSVQKAEAHGEQGESGREWAEGGDGVSVVRVA